MEVSLYNGTVSVKFNEGNHSYYVNGERAKSVTTIVNMLDNPQLTYWKLKMSGEYLNNLIKQGITISPAHVQEALKYHEVVSGEAKDIGTIVHDYCERFARASMAGEKLPDIPTDVDDKIISGIQAFLDWYSSHDIKFLEVEKIIYSQELEYVGKFDAIALIDGKKTLIDYKTSKGIYSNQDWQLCGYKRAYEEEFKDETVSAMLLHFDKEIGIFTPHYVENIDEKMEIFELLAKLKKLL